MKKLYFVLLLPFFACGSKETTPAPINNKDLTEISGIAASQVHDGLFYVHNDSGDSSRFFAVNEKGSVNATYYFSGDPAVKGGVTDCEDIAVGAGPVSGRSYIYLADIGDNNATRTSTKIFRFEEPTTISNNTIAASTFNIKYPDGPRDAETIMVDNKDRLIYIVTKREDNIRIYTLSLDVAPNQTYTLQYRNAIHIPGVAQANWVVAGDISADGNKVLIKTYEKVFYWERNAGEHIWETLARVPKELPYTVDGISEAIALNKNSTYYYTVPEGANPVITKYPLKP
jgi:hypothetical protein